MSSGGGGSAPGGMAIGLERTCRPKTEATAPFTASTAALFSMNETPGSDSGRGALALDVTGLMAPTPAGPPSTYAAARKGDNDLGRDGAGGGGVVAAGAIGTSCVAITFVDPLAPAVAGSGSDADVRATGIGTSPTVIKRRPIACGGVGGRGITLGLGVKATFSQSPLAGGGAKSTAAHVPHCEGCFCEK